LRHWENERKPGGTEIEWSMFVMLIYWERTQRQKNTNSLLDANEDVCAEMNAYVTRKQSKIIT
jgi:hypothetical protein